MCANVLGVELKLVNVNLLHADNLKEEYWKVSKIIAFFVFV